MTAAQRERAALVATMRETGPDAPTLCSGWRTRDLAAHLVLREYRPDAAAGIAIPRLAEYTAKVQQEIAAGDWEELLDKIADGPPIYSPIKLFDSVANTAEMFIHHEDVRRAQPDWAPRTLNGQIVTALRRTLPLRARLTLAKAPARVALRTPEGKTLLTAGRGPAVTVTGPAEELLLFAVGRQARVEFGGDDSAIAAVQAAPRRI